MALVSCPECGREVSDRATACIHCGFPLTQPKSELVIKGKRIPDALVKHIYFLYCNDSLFDEVLPGEVKRYTITQPIKLVLGHKRGGFLNCAVRDSDPILVEPGKITRLEASYGQGFMPKYFLSEVDVIDSE